MSFNARIRKINRVGGYQSLVFQVVENWRDKSKGMKPNHRTVLHIGSIKDYQVNSPNIQKKMWLKIDLSMNHLLKSGTISEVEKQKIEKRFAEFVPRPMLSKIVPPKPKVTLESLRQKYPILKP